MAQCSSQKEILHNLKVCKVIVYKLPIRQKGKIKSNSKENETMETDSRIKTIRNNHYTETSATKQQQ